MEAAFFDLIEERITPPPPHLRVSETNFRKPLEVGLKLADILRHLAMGKSYTLLQYHWTVGRTTIIKFVPKVCKAILREFQKEYLILRSHQGEQRDHQLQQMTYKHHRITRGEQGLDENVRNLFMEAKLQKDLLKDYFNNLGALAGQEDRI